MKIGKLRLPYYALLITSLLLAGCSYDDGDVSGSPAASEGDVIAGIGGGSATGGDNLSTAESATTQAAGFNQVPRAAMTINTTEGAAPLDISINARGSYDPDGNNPVQYRWSFGDGSPQKTTYAANHVYDTPGNYRLTLTVIDIQGRTAQTARNITVRSGAPGESQTNGNQTAGGQAGGSQTGDRPPVAKINLNTTSGVATLTVSMNPNGSYDPDGTPLSYLWKTGDGNSSNTWANEHQYNNPGNYTVQLTVSDATGKSTTVSKQINVSSADQGNTNQTDNTTSPINTPYSLSNNDNSAFGTNVASIRDWISSQPFVDIFKTARAFRQHSPAGITYDENGWPKNLNGKTAKTFLIPRMKSGAIPYGNYTVLYDGNGYIDYNSTKVKVIQRKPGRDVIEIKGGDEAISLLITQSNPDNYLRNIRILMPGGICRGNPLRHVSSVSNCSNGDYMDYENHHDEIIFNPDYLRFMAPFKVLRFMEFMDANDSEVKDWSQRTRMSEATWGSDGTNTTGAPIEIMVELANRLNADPWFTLPHKATDDYVRKFAQYVQQNLNSDLKVYIEYSNEVWNGMFTQTEYARQRGVALNLDASRTKAGQKFYSQRSVEIFKIWENVFSGTNRLVRVLATQSAVPYITETIVTHNNAYKHADAIAVAPYFGGDPTPFRNVNSVDAVFQLLRNNTYARSLSKIQQEMREQAEISRQYDLDLIAYEGGQHLVDWTTKQDDQHPNPLFYQANRDARMGQLYTEYLQSWKAEGGKLFVQFSSPRFWDRYGSWGLKEHLNESDSAPKFKAVMDFSRSNPRWW